MISDVTSIVRNSHADDKEAFFQILRETFGNLEHLPRVGIDLDRIDPTRQRFLIAEAAGRVTGCIGIIGLPRKQWNNLRFLAVRDAFSDPHTVEKLVSKAIEIVQSEGYEYLKATTPAVQPYVDAYKKFNFIPVRRPLQLPVF